MENALILRKSDINVGNTDFIHQMHSSGLITARYVEEN
nr:MAG TPA: hypothetical protein [Caudoviricetes sp.]DAX50908.1 MAG TPA: hypothetical protein [Bacteriophage sp.]